jgi:hypothetical protein
MKLEIAVNAPEGIARDGKMAKVEKLLVEPVCVVLIDQALGGNRGCLADSFFFFSLPFRAKRSR